jgi:hypothetical protein
MALSLLTIIFAAASAGGGGLGGAQAAYMRCLATELDAAVGQRIDSESFARGVPSVCESETALYRRMAVAAIVGQGAGGASPAAAEKRFLDFDRANRAELITTFEERMRLRRGPSRVAGAPAAATRARD